LQQLKWLDNLRRRGFEFPSAMPASESLSISQDDYLERILELVQQKGYARIADLATDLKVRGASASGMVKRLAGAGLLEREAYRGFVLTDAGRKRAQKIQERHQVLAAFFKTIGVDTATATRDIDGIEHYLSDKSVAALKRVTTKLNRR
jgi:Mn-dependent DtxR family transcriptional regulator